MKAMIRYDMIFCSNMDGNYSAKPNINIIIVNRHICTSACVCVHLR